MKLKDLAVPFKASWYPLLPIVPECSFCAAMRFAFIGCVISGFCTGFTFRHTIEGLVLGVIYGFILTITLWAHYHLTKDGDSNG